MGGEAGTRRQQGKGVNLLEAALVAATLSQDGAPRAPAATQSLKVAAQSCSSHLHGCWASLGAWARGCGREGGWPLPVLLAFGRDGAWRRWCRSTLSRSSVSTRRQRQSTSKLGRVCSASAGQARKGGWNPNPPHIASYSLVFSTYLHVAPRSTRCSAAHPLCHPTLLHHQLTFSGL